MKNIKQSVGFLICLLSVINCNAATKQDQYINQMIAKESEDRFAWHSSITSEMFEEWLELGQEPYGFEYRNTSWFSNTKDASEVCASPPDMQSTLLCYVELLSMMDALLNARVSWLEGEGEGYLLEPYLKAHQEYSEKICTGLVELDYGDLTNSYSNVVLLSCSVEYTESFMNNFLSNFHGASFR